MSDIKFEILVHGKPISQLREKGYVRPINHKYFICTGEPMPGMVTEVGKIITSTYLKNTQKKTKRIKTDLQTYTISYGESHEHKSELVNYKIITRDVRENCSFRIDKFKLPELDSFWLDRSVDVSINFHSYDNPDSILTIQDGTTEAQFGKTYPIKPKLDREGHFFSTFQPTLVNRIVDKRRALIESSDRALYPEWLFEFRDIIINTISLIDITLNQIYIKAEYDKKPEWNFDIENLGPRHGQRLLDKIKWISKITGKVYNLNDELIAINRLRRLRNHFNHFDPPTFQITLEEIEIYLNDIPRIGLFLHKTRLLLGEHTPSFIVNMFVQSSVKFVPEPAFIKRLPLNSKLNGFESCQWPEN